MLVSCYSWMGRYTTIQGKLTTAHTPYIDWTGRRFWYVDVAGRDQGLPTQSTGAAAAPSPLSTPTPAALRESYVDDLFTCVQPGIVLQPKDDQPKDDHHRLTTFQRPQASYVVQQGDAILGDPIFRVGFISDVHIRQTAVKLFSDNVSRSLDDVINSFERNGYQEAFQSAVYAATISAFNQLAGPDDKPRLIINTGDATDAGSIEEAYDFVSVSHHLRYPMLYALGNHDDAIFGNFKADIGYTKDAGPTFYPVGQKARFLMFFNPVPTIAGLGDDRIPLPGGDPTPKLRERWGVLDVLREKDGVEAAAPANACPPGHDPRQCKFVTLCNGFNLNPRVQPSSPGAPPRCEQSIGYYSVTLPGTTEGTKVQLIALNTTRETDWGQDAAFGTDQQNWLDGELRKSADVTILFMHHRPSNVPNLMPILNKYASGRAMVVLSAHDHSYTTQWLGRFWEINTGSLEEFPQWSRLVEIRRQQGRYLLNARTIRPQLPILENPPDLTGAGVQAGTYPDFWDTQGGRDTTPIPNGANAAALGGRRVLHEHRLEKWFESEFEKCDAIAAHLSGQCGQNPAALLESAQCGYIGALYDHLVVNKSTQSGAEASGQANVILDISPSP